MAAVSAHQTRVVDLFCHLYRFEVAGGFWVGKNQHIIGMRRFV
jgi:hypothetical protein